MFTYVYIYIYTYYITYLRFVSNETLCIHVNAVLAHTHMRGQTSTQNKRVRSHVQLIKKSDLFWIHSIFFVFS